MVGLVLGKVFLNFSIDHENVSFTYIHNRNFSHFLLMFGK